MHIKFPMIIGHLANGTMNFSARILLEDQEDRNFYFLGFYDLYFSIEIINLYIFNPIPLEVI